MPDEDYLQGLEKWRAEMDANLRRENDRLALAGLFWLQKGFNTFGSSQDCDIILPKPAPRLLGAFEYDGTDVKVGVDLGQTIQLNGEPLQSTIAINTDDTDDPSFVSYEHLRLVAIRRAHGVGVRWWDNSRPQRQDFPPRLWFPPDESCRVRAVYTPYPVPMRVMLPNVLGEMQDDFMHGYVSFNLLGRSHRLEVSELQDGRLYIQFKDRTNGVKTYPAGRYVYTETVAEDGGTFVDFNKAFNPPSAFSEFSTSTFAPRQNYMKVPVEAGEMFSLPE